MADVQTSPLCAFPVAQTFAPVDWELLSFVYENMCDADGIERLANRAWGLSKGIPTFRAMARNTRESIRLMEHLKVTSGIAISQGDFKYFRGLASAIRRRLSMVKAESEFAKTYPTPHLHALQVARLYCEFLGYTEELAACLNSRELRQLSDGLSVVDKDKSTEEVANA